MKTTRKVLAGAILASFLGAAHAVPLEFSQTITSFDGSLANASSTLSYTHDLTLLEVPYSFALHDFLSGSLQLTFTTSGNSASESDTISVFLDGPDATFSGTASFLSGEALNITSYFDAEFGTLGVSMSRGANQGNISLTQSVLTVFADLRDTVVDPGDDNGVPEPGTLALLGLGLLGGVLVRRRKA